MVQLVQEGPDYQEDPERKTNIIMFLSSIKIKHACPIETYRHSTYCLTWLNPPWVLTASPWSPFRPLVPAAPVLPPAPNGPGVPDKPLVPASPCEQIIIITIRFWLRHFVYRQHQFSGFLHHRFYMYELNWLTLSPGCPCCPLSPGAPLYPWEKHI